MRAAERAERFAVSPGTMERQHQQPTEAFVKRKIDRETLELADEQLVSTQCEIGLDPISERHEAHLAQTRDLREQDRRVIQAGVRAPAPHRKRLTQPICRLTRPGCHQWTDLLHRSAEHPLVDVLLTDPQRVAPERSVSNPSPIRWRR